MQIDLETKFGKLEVHIGSLNNVVVRFEGWTVLRVKYDAYLYWERSATNMPFVEDKRHGRINRSSDMLSYPSEAARKAIREEIARVLNDYARTFPATFMTAQLHMLESAADQARKELTDAEQALEAARNTLWEAEQAIKTFRKLM